MLSHKRFVKLSRGIIGALAGGPSKDSTAAKTMDNDTIEGIKIGGFLAVQLYAAAFADELGIDPLDMFEEVGLPRKALGNGGQAQLDKIVRNSRVEEDPVNALMRRHAAE